MESSSGFLSLLSFTTSSLLHRAHRTRSLPWHSQPRFAHSISFIRSGFGVHSVSSWNVPSRRISSSRSPGQYLDAGVGFSILPTVAMIGLEPYFCRMALFANRDGAVVVLLGPRVDASASVTRLRLLSILADDGINVVLAAVRVAAGVAAGAGVGLWAPVSRVDVFVFVGVVGRTPVACIVVSGPLESGAVFSEAFSKATSVVDLPPMPWTRELNLRFVAFIVAVGAGSC